MYIISICVHTHTQTYKALNPLITCLLKTLQGLLIWKSAFYAECDGGMEMSKCSKWRQPNPPPHTHTHVHLHKPIYPEHSKESRHLQYHSIHNQDSVLQPGSTAPSQCPVQWGLMECLISWQTHAFTQKCKVILTFTKKRKKNYNSPSEESASPFVNKQERKTRDVCSLIATHSQNANPALQMCIALNSHVPTELFRNMASMDRNMHL